jgi:hypothetical protein
MKKILLYVWQLPQNLIALVYRIIFRPGKPTMIIGGDVNVYTWKLRRVGVSLGNNIFVPSNSGYRMISHEYGHTIQSKVLGPLYLFLIALPSAIWFTIYVLFLRKSKIKYTWFFIESMADKLGSSLVLSKS